MTLVRATEVTKRFGDLVAVDRVDLGVEGGEVVGLLGANGAGKTTLVRMVLGLLRPTAGEVRLFGEAPSRRTRRRIGYVPQSLGLYEDLTVEENLEFGAAVYGSEPGALGEDLAEAADELVGDLPLGLKRRAAFAEALAHRPDLLVLDEPTSGVDPLGRARLWDEIRDAAEGGAGVLVTTHHMEEAEYCDRLVVMVTGRVAAEGRMAEIVGDATALEVRAERWEEAFEVLEDAGIPLALVGRALRLPGAETAAIREALEARGIAAEVTEVPATFEEAFVAVSSAAEPSP